MDGGKRGLVAINCGSSAWTLYPARRGCRSRARAENLSAGRRQRMRRRMGRLVPSTTRAMNELIVRTSVGRRLAVCVAAWTPPLCRSGPCCPMHRTRAQHLDRRTTRGDAHTHAAKTRRNHALPLAIRSMRKDVDRRKGAIQVWHKASRFHAFSSRKSGAEGQLPMSSLTGSTQPLERTHTQAQSGHRQTARLELSQ